MNGRPSRTEVWNAGNFRKLTGLAAAWLFATARLFAATESEPSNAIPALLPPQGEIPPTFWEQHGWAVVFCSIALLLLTAFAVWLLSRPRPAAVVPPEVQIRRTLEALRRQTEDGDVLSRVTQALRQYVGAVFDLPPDQVTTTEFCRALADHERVGLELAAAVGDFLRRCDERKFAPTASTAPLGAAARALELVELTEVRRAQLRQNAPPPTGGQSVKTA